MIKVNPSLLQDSRNLSASFLETRMHRHFEPRKKVNVVSLPEMQRRAWARCWLFCSVLSLITISEHSNLAVVVDVLDMAKEYVRNGPAARTISRDSKTFFQEKA